MVYVIEEMMGDILKPEHFQSRVRADMAFFETPKGGAVFAVGSMAWCGSLAHDNYQNNVARLTGNVLRRFRDSRKTLTMTRGRKPHWGGRRSTVGLTPEERFSVRADRRAVLAAVTLNVVAMIATFLLQPQFVEAAVTDLKFTEGQAGIVAAVLMAGSTVASLVACLWVRPTQWRIAASVALLGLLVANLASMLIHRLEVFCALQGVAGLCGGSLIRSH